MTRTILITGCSSGIGLAAATLLRERDWRVFAGCRQSEDVSRLERDGYEALPLDYADPDSLSAALDTVLTRTGGTLDALYNNGAYAVPGAVEDLPVEGLRAIFEANLFGWHALTRSVIPVMRAQGHGRIVNCSSVLGIVPMRWRGAYVATKFALEGLTDVLRIEMRDTPIHVVTLRPGPITSRIRVNSIPHFERWIDWRKSPRRAQYERSLIDRLYAERGPDPFELPAAAVAEKLLHALETPSPRGHYNITKATHLMAAARRLLPARALDAMIARR
ncbi:short-subunit dehydrogenase [Palleronia aestuarii]|uniref:Short-subunit dehydrogenase n=1 Tax=Palleronia aestuarii TaxID=568105 RepID=A0A2W7NTJ2_9RHOB|nr:SDR family NAD(P)-dependent oxidoreductase [Palleronia aestuarii]PZX16656.1 short-subunit dehydrogenase [Palleronia aestuarii]